MRTSASGRSQWVVPSQATHSDRNTASGRLSHVCAAGSRTPASQPRSPPSTLAAAVAGYGVPAVARLKTTAGATHHEGDDREDANTRRTVSGRASDEERNEQEGLRTRQDGQRRAAPPSRARGRARGRGARRPPAAPRARPPCRRARPRRSARPGRARRRRRARRSAARPRRRAARRVTSAAAESRRMPRILAIASEAQDDGGARAEQERPQRRGRAGHRHARVVGEAGALGEVAREVQMDPRVVQRKPGSARRSAARARRRARAGAGSRRRRARQRATGRAPPSSSPRPGTRGADGAARRLRADEGVARVARPGCGRAAARRDSGRTGSRSRRARAAARSPGSSGRRTRRVARPPTGRSIVVPGDRRHRRRPRGA